MDERRIDALARALASGASRRRLLIRAVAGVAGGLAARRAGRAGAQPGCRRAGHPCEGNQVCCEGLICAPSGPGASSRCAPPGGCTAECEPPAVATLPYAVAVDCDYDAAADQTNCAFAADAKDGGEPIVSVVLLTADLCASVVGGDYEDVASASGGKRGRGKGLKSKGRADDGSPVLTVIFAGRVETGATVTYWCATENAVVPATGPGLLCPQSAPPDDISDSTGAMVVEVSTCSAESYPDDFDWYGQCDVATEATTFALSIWDGARFVEQASGTTDADGIVRFGQLKPGTYDLAQVGAVWCHAECDRVNEKGEVIVEAGQRTNVWIFNCPEGATSVATEEVK